MQTLEHSVFDTLNVTIAGVDGSIRAPQPVISVLNRVLAHARRPASSPPGLACIEVLSDEVAWRINGGSEDSRKILSARSALPQVAGAIVSSLIADVASAAGLNVARAAVIERDGYAVAFVGDDWESCITLAAHLHVRGWHLLGGDYALIDLPTLNVLGARKLLYVTLSCVDDLPLTYLRAVEDSPWYSTMHDIAFYAVDPALAVPRECAWAEFGRLRAVLRLDGHVSEYPSLERAAQFTIGQGIRSDDLERAGVTVAEIKLGDFVTTCDLLERWLTAQLAG
jgi:hypothetical protein